MVKRIVRLVALLAVLAGAALCENSWDQINQGLARDDGWRQIVRDTSAFSLGEKTSYAGDKRLSIQAWGSYPSMDGSTVCVPMAIEFARQWLGLSDADLTGFVNFSTTPYAYERLTRRGAAMLSTIASQKVMMDDAHSVDLVLGTGPNLDEKAAAEAAGVNLVMTPVCYDAFVFLVNGANPVDSLTPAQIRDIYTDAQEREEPEEKGSYAWYEWFEARTPVIENWAEVGGDDEEIIAYQRPHGSGSQTAMEEMVMKGQPIFTAEEVRTIGGMGAVIQQIGAYDNAEGAIGYSYLYYIDELYRSGDVKVLAVDGVAPTPENLRSGAYAYTVCYYAVYEAGNEVAERFAHWITSDEGQACVAQAGYISLR